MKVAIGVVLQREVSLSRRVYTWLLGPEDTSEKQIAYLQQNSSGSTRLDSWKRASPQVPVMTI